MTSRYQKLAQDCTRRLAHVLERKDYDFTKHAPSSEDFPVQAYDENKQNHDFSKHESKLGGHQDEFGKLKMTKFGSRTSK